MHLAAALSKTPAEIDAMPFLDSLMLLETIHTRSQANRRFEAAVHGLKLKGE